MSVGYANMQYLLKYEHIVFTIQYEFRPLMVLFAHHTKGPLKICIFSIMNIIETISLVSIFRKEPNMLTVSSTINELSSCIKDECFFLLIVCIPKTNESVQLQSDVN